MSTLLARLARSAGGQISAEFPGGVLRYTDDTVMAISIVEVLDQHGCIGRGASWRAASGRAFGGKGSMGNALLSAEVTHAHNEGQAGAIAVAAAASHFAGGGSERHLFAELRIRRAAALRGTTDSHTAARELGSGNRVLVGSIISAKKDLAVPPDWLEAREPLDA